MAYPFIKKKDAVQGMRIITPKKQPMLPLRPCYLNFEEPGKELISSSLRTQVQLRDNFSCRYCGHRVFGGKHMHTHHLNSTENAKDNLVTCCCACHAVNHIGLGLIHGTIEIWKSPISQVEIVKMSRKAIAAGKTLASVKNKLKLKEDYLAPNDIAWTQILPSGKARFTYLDEFDKNLKVVFVRFKMWQLDAAG